MVVWSEDRDAERHQWFSLIRNIGHSIFNLLLPREAKMKKEEYLRLPWDEVDDITQMPEDVKEKSLANLRAAMKKANWNVDEGS